MIAVVAARDEHRDAFIRMARDAFDESGAVSLGAYEPLVAERIIDRSIEWNILNGKCEAGGGRVFVALDDETPIGVLAVTLQPLYFAPATNYAHELFVFVEPHARGRGVARMLFTAAIDWARDVGAKGLIAAALPTAKSASVGAVCKKLGFEVLEPTWIKELA